MSFTALDLEMEIARMRREAALREPIQPQAPKPSPGCADAPASAGGVRLAERRQDRGRSHVSAAPDIPRRREAEILLAWSRSLGEDEIEGVAV